MKMTIAEILIFPLGAAIGAWLIIFYSTYVSMTKDHSHKFSRGTYQNFIDQFHSREWTRDGWPDSFFCHSDDSEIHAGIYRFSGHGMLLGPVDYWRSTRFIKSQAEPRETSDSPWGAK